MSADVTATFAAKDESFATTVNRLQQTLNGFGQNVESFNAEFASVAEGFKSAATKAGALVLGFIGVSSAFDGLKQSFNKAAEFQDMQRRFETLLGSTEAAQERMDELNQFMDRTPFELPGIVRANVALQNLTGGALATEQGMTKVGDAAAALGVPFEEMAQLVGRVHSALESGAPIGRYTNRLLELGVITPQARRELEEMKNEVNSGKRGWELIEQELSKFTGSMQRQSTTWNSTMSGFSDAVDNAMRAFAAPLLPPLTAAVQQLANLVRDDLAPGIERAMNAFATDWLPGMLNAFSSVREAGAAFNQLMITGAKELGNATFDNLSQAFRAAATGYRELMNAGSMGWLQTLEAAWYVVSDKMAVFFMQGLQGALNLVSGIIPGAQAAASGIAALIAAATQRIENNMIAAEENAAAALEAFKEGASKAEFIEHKLFDSSKNADKVAEYLENAKIQGAAPIEQHIEKAAQHSQSVENSFAEAEQSAKAAAQAAWRASEFGERYKEFFAEAETEVGKIREQSGSTEESGRGFRDFIEEAYPHAEEIKRAAKETEEHGFGFAENVKEGVIDAAKIYDMFVGPGSLLGAFDQSMERTQQLKGAIESLDSKTKEASIMRQHDSRMDAAARQYERAEDRAQNQRERGYNKTAEETMRRARETYTRTELSQRYEAFSKILMEQDLQASREAQTFAEELEMRRQALNDHKERMSQAADYVNNQMQSASNHVGSALNAAASEFFAAGSAGQQAGIAIEGATNALNQLIGNINTQNTQLALESTLKECRNFLEDINEKLPQNSLS
jgi:hypothetical protein